MIDSSDVRCADCGAGGRGIWHCHSCLRGHKSDAWYEGRGAVRKLEQEVHDLRKENQRLKNLIADHCLAEINAGAAKTIAGRRP